jgi:hypothetical protein
MVTHARAHWALWVQAPGTVRRLHRGQDAVRPARRVVVVSCRLVILWHTPRQADADDIREWVESQAAALAGMPGAEHVRLSRLGPASTDFTSPYGWMLEMVLDGTRPLGELVVSTRSENWYPSCANFV